MTSRVQTRAVLDDEAGLRLDRWFQRHFPELEPHFGDCRNIFFPWKTGGSA